jgi:hypothetical protein
MKKYFIEDTTKNVIASFDTIPQLLTYMGEVCQRKFGKSREAFMTEAQDLGHVMNDNADSAFVEVMSSQFQIGIGRSNSRVVCDIFRADQNEKTKDAQGD